MHTYVHEYVYSFIHINVRKVIYKCMNIKLPYICAHKFRWWFLKVGRQVDFVQRYKVKGIKYASITAVKYMAR
jgi:hypothetical protein